MKAIQSFLIGLAVCVTGCFGEAPERQVIPVQAPVQAPVAPTAIAELPSDPEPEPISSEVATTLQISLQEKAISSVFPFGIGELGHCVAFAIGPRDVITAAHCLSGPHMINHPVTGENIPLYPVDFDFHSQGLDRARFILPVDQPDFQTWLEVSPPTKNDIAVMLGVRNNHHLLLKVMDQRPDGQWNLFSFNGEDAWAGDSGSPVVSITTGKVIGTLSSYGPALSPIHGF